MFHLTSNNRRTLTIVLISLALTLSILVGLTIAASADGGEGQVKLLGQDDAVSSIVSWLLIFMAGLLLGYLFMELIKRIIKL